MPKANTKLKGHTPGGLRWRNAGESAPLALPFRTRTPMASARRSARSLPSMRSHRGGSRKKSQKKNRTRKH